MTDLTMSQFASKDDLLAAQAARIAELESQLEAIGAGGVEPLRKPAAAPQEEAIAEIVSASHDQAEFGERGINFLRDIQHLEYGTKLYPAPQAVQAAVPDGWKRVPIKPTPEMCHVGRYGGDKDAPAYGEKPAEGVTAWPFVADHTAEQIYQSMLAAAPAHPAEGVPAQAVKPGDALIEAVDKWFADNTGLGGCSDKDVAELAAIFAATQPAAQGMEADLTDEQIDEAFNQMPDGAAGFLKSWGYRQFARAVLAAQAKQGGA